MTTGRINQVTRQIHRGGGTAPKGSAQHRDKRGRNTSFANGTRPDSQPTNSARPSTKNSQLQERHSLGKQRPHGRNTSTTREHKSPENTNRRQANSHASKNKHSASSQQEETQKNEYRLFRRSHFS